MVDRSFFWKLNHRRFAFDVDVVKLRFPVIRRSSFVDFRLSQKKHRTSVWKINNYSVSFIPKHFKLVYLKFSVKKITFYLCVWFNISLPKITLSDGKTNFSKHLDKLLVIPGLHSASILSTLKKLLLAITSLSGLNLGWANNFPKAGPPFWPGTNETTWWIWNQVIIIKINDRY